MDTCTPLVLLSLITYSAGALDSWSRPQTQPQTLHSLMVSIDERLHTLENAKMDSTLREMGQKLESLETTFRRLDSTFQERLDKLERNLNSKELKDELMVEKLSHKMRDILDTSYDRYSRRLGYTEERLEMSLKKVQMSVEGILNRMEKQQEDIQTDVTETVALVEDLKTYYTTTDDRLNSTHKAIHQQIQGLMTPNGNELQRISGSLEQISSRLNGSLALLGSQNDGPQTSDLLSSIRVEINLESSKITNKMNNMYNEMWRRVVSVESLLKELGRLGNTTRQEILEEVHSLAPSDRDFPGDSQENFLEVALDALERKLQKLSRNVDDRMDSLTAKQDLVLDSCFEGGVCRGLESRLSQVLERIFEIFSDKIENSTNGTLNLNGLIMEMMELVKSQHSHLIRTVTHNTNMVVTSAKDNSDANKLLHHNITQLATSVQELHKELENVSNSGGNICTENTTTPELKTPIEFPSANISGEKQPTDPPKKQYDVGVLKITTDNLEVLADNTSLTADNTSHVIDNSIMEIITTISPNLTSEQIDSLLRVLNRSVNFDALEVIIQNTEAEQNKDGGSAELKDSKLLSPTNSEVVFTSEKENTSENNFIQEEDLAQITTDNTIILNGTIFTDTGINETVKDSLNSTSEILSSELKEQLRLYTFLWKIKNRYINSTLLRKNLEEVNESEPETIQLLSVLQKLCYGQDKEENGAMKKNLLLIKQALSKTDMYDKIDNICNIMTESIHRNNLNKEDIL